MEYLIYFDVCCLNRPFDDQTQERVLQEAKAVRLIIDRCHSGDWAMLGSEAIDAELDRTPTGTRKQQMETWVALAMTTVAIDEQIYSRAAELFELGFKNYDAVSGACRVLQDKSMRKTPPCTSLVRKWEMPTYC